MMERAGLGARQHPETLLEVTGADAHVTERPAQPCLTKPWDGELLSEVASNDVGEEAFESIPLSSGSFGAGVAPARGE
jgi:hypothetical protein